MYLLRCFKCGDEFSPEEIIYTCKSCGGLLEVILDLDKIEVTIKELDSRKIGVWRYREFMPVGRDARVITMKEGGTPLYKAENLESDLGIKELYVKNEGANPTGSFKDRGMTIGVTKALEFKVSAVGCASTGNTSAALSVYAGKAGLKCIVLLPTGKIAKGKLAQAILHGAQIIGIRGNFDKALELIIEACDIFNIYLLNSINPWRLEGQKTEGYEIVDQLRWKVPDVIVVPVGNCGNISAIWKGLNEFYNCGFIDRLPRMMGIQAEGAAPVVNAFEGGLEEAIPIENPETVASAIRIGAPVNAPKALKAIRDSGGCAEKVSDKEIITAQATLARREGIGVEPASAASIAGLTKLLDRGIIEKDESVVCVTTGHALKDPEIIFTEYEKPLEIEPDIERLKKLIGTN
ncbi:MAG: threonine synthase [Candidatus Hydrothermarchaeales archaeon]